MNDDRRNISCRDIIREDEIPKDMRAEACDYRHELIEHVSGVDEQLGEMFIGNIFVNFVNNHL